MSLLNKLIYFSKKATVSADKHIVTTDTPRAGNAFTATDGNLIKLCVLLME